MRAVGWQPHGELDEPKWAAVGRRISAIERASQWWIGDWLRYGAARWGEKYAQAARITGYDVPSLRNMAWLASEFDVSRRRDDLSWSHHAAVAGCDRDEQERWLCHAADRRLSVADLRFEIRSARREHSARCEQHAQEDATPHVCPTCGQRIPDGRDRPVAPLTR